jgi:hypothetical protein
VTINAPSTFQKPATNGNNKYIKLQGIQRELIILHPLTEATWQCRLWQIFHDAKFYLFEAPILKSSH